MGLVPPIDTTVTSTVSTASPGGDVAVIDESSSTVNPTGVSPKLTLVAWVKFVPVIVATVPPLRGPLFGLSADTEGVPTNVNRSIGLVALVPPGDVTVTSTVATLANGATAEIDVSPFTVKLAAYVPPKRTAVAAVNPVPVIDSVVPPDAGPMVGDMPVTRGDGTNPGASTRYALFDWL